MARPRRKQRIKDVKPRETYWDGYPYFRKPPGWKPPQAVRFDRLKAEYAKRYSEGKGWNLMDIIKIFWRENMTVSETALILDETEETIKFAIDEVRDKAR